MPSSVTSKNVTILSSTSPAVTSSTTASTLLQSNASTPAKIWIGYNAPKKNRRFEFDRYKYCLSFKSCEECTSAALFACGWCHHYGCTHKPDLFCPEIKHKATDNNESCPYVTQTGPITNHIGTIGITLKTRIPDPTVHQLGVVCKITLGDKRLFVKGYITNEIVNCEHFEHRDKNNIKGTVQLVWGGAAPLSNEVQFVLYSCESVGKTCSACKAIKSDFECGWCTGQDKCTLWSRCRLRSDQWAAGDRLNCQKINATIH
ncbi:hypothetical protein O0L34_g2229 [Tuta absoluta]|nr:hypothetical protein O0L34_g2229 [Tuta absoluta]